MKQVFGIVRKTSLPRTGSTRFGFASGRGCERGMFLHLRKAFTCQQRPSGSGATVPPDALPANQRFSL